MVTLDVWKLFIVIDFNVTYFNAITNLVTMTYGVFFLLGVMLSVTVTSSTWTLLWNLIKKIKKSEAVYLTLLTFVIRQFIEIFFYYLVVICHMDTVNLKFFIYLPLLHLSHWHLTYWHLSHLKSVTLTFVTLTLVVI